MRLQSASTAGYCCANEGAFPRSKKNKVLPVSFTSIGILFLAEGLECIVKSDQLPRSIRCLHDRRPYMKIGWSVLLVDSTIALTGPLVAVRSTRRATFSANVFDWPGPQFLLIMFAELALFVTFVAIGVLNRKLPRVHLP